MQAATIDRVTLIVSELDQAEDDYVTTFGCVVERRDAIEPSLTSVLGIPEASGRRSLLRLGRERIELLEFTNSLGRPYPADSTSTDIWFQHMAIVVTDMNDGHQRVAAQQRFTPISRNGPVRLPADSGGVTAFKFRDHDGHPLELIAFPAATAPREWRNRNDASPFLGIDHTAIVVRDSGISSGFFRSVFGFCAGPRIENRGPAQAELDDVDDVHVSVTQLAIDRPAPRLELLRYHVGTRRPIRPGTASNDIAATHSAVEVASLDATLAALTRFSMPSTRYDRMTLHEETPAALVTGPDGHRFLVEERDPARLVSIAASKDPSQDPSARAEPRHKAALPERLHGTPVVVLAHIGDCLTGRYAIEDGKAGQCRASASATSEACDLDPLDSRSLPHVSEHRQQLVTISGEPEIRPAKPVRLPRNGRGLVGQQVQAHSRRRPGRQRPGHPASADQPPGRQAQHSERARVPEAVHSGIVAVTGRRPVPRPVALPMTARPRREGQPLLIHLSWNGSGRDGMKA